MFNDICLWDNMWTAETFFWVKNKFNKPIWKINKLSLSDINNLLSEYEYINYIKNIIEKWEATQDYSNLLLLSNLLKKINNEIPNWNRIYK